jgi:hypothetical protein
MESTSRGVLDTAFAGYDGGESNHAGNSYPIAD